MKKTIKKYEFIHSMQSYYDGHDFSYEGLCALFDYLEECEQKTGEELELNILSLHRQFSEMTVEEFINDYLTDDEDEQLRNDLDVKDLDEISSYDFYEYMYHNSYHFYLKIIAIVNDNTIIVDTER